MGERQTMEGSIMLVHMLHEQADGILNDAVSAMQRAHCRHYEEMGEDHVRARLKALFILTQRALKERNLGPMLAHAEAVAEERFTAGFDLAEVQTAFNVLEEAIWWRIVQRLPRAEYAEAFGLLGTVLGAGKDALARKYVSLASSTKVPSLHLEELFH
jgi:hypothetical protein